MTVVAFVTNSSNTAMNVRIANFGESQTFENYRNFILFHKNNLALKKDIYNLLEDKVSLIIRGETQRNRFCADRLYH